MVSFQSLRIRHKGHQLGSCDHWFLRRQKWWPPKFDFGLQSLSLQGSKFLELEPPESRHLCRSCTPQHALLKRESTNFLMKKNEKFIFIFNDIGKFISENVVHVFGIFYFKIENKNN